MQSSKGEQSKDYREKLGKKLITRLQTTVEGEPEWKIEKQVVSILLSRIFQIGYPHYGEMTNNMELNHLREALEEVIDGMVYTAMQILKLEKQIYGKEKVDDSGDKSEQLQQGEDDNIELATRNISVLTTGE
jgi:hypothetical protein